MGVILARAHHTGWCSTGNKTNMKIHYSISANAVLSIQVTGINNKHNPGPFKITLSIPEYLQRSYEQFVTFFGWNLAISLAFSRHDAFCSLTQEVQKCSTHLFTKTQFINAKTFKSHYWAEENHQKTLKSFIPFP